MAQQFLEGEDIHSAYEAATKEADQWRVDYPEFERLMNNGLLSDLDETLPEVNDGSLAAALFKLPKRIINSNMTGRAKALDRDDAWLTELANLQWENNIVPNANSQAPFHRKWKDAVRKAAGYGSQPIINLFVDKTSETTYIDENGEEQIQSHGYCGSDFIVPLATDVKLEAGKVSDYDSDIIFWDVYYSELQWKNMIEEAKDDKKSGDTTNKWYIEDMEVALKAEKADTRSGNEEARQRQDKGVQQTGIHCYIAFQRGVEAPFCMYHKGTKKPMREWANPDPTGDVPVHYLYCYQDFINPYGIGIVKLAGGTQNVLDYMRQADVLATQLGLRPPRTLRGPNTDEVDYDQLAYTEDAIWDIGNNELTREEMSDGVYRELPNRINMYKSSLNNLIPMGDTSVSADAGDPLQSKTPAGVKMAQANLSIDDEDFKDNVKMCFNAVAKSMINTHFANMQGSDPIKLTDEERELLSKAGIEFPVDMEGNPTNELIVEWEQARGTFDFEVDPDDDKTTDEATQIEGLFRATELIKDPAVQQLAKTGQPLILGNKKVDVGELLGTLIGLVTDNDKIVTEVTPEELDAQALAQEQAAMAGGIDPMTGQPVDPMAAEQPVAPEMQPPEAVEGEVMLPEGEITPEQAAVNVQAVMEQYGVDQEVAAAMLEAERQGWSDEEIAAAFLSEEPANA